jgi:hypothetical protein
LKYGVEETFELLDLPFSHPSFVSMTSLIGFMENRSHSAITLLAIVNLSVEPDQWAILRFANPAKKSEESTHFPDLRDFMWVLPRPAFAANSAKVATFSRESKSIVLVNVRPLDRLIPIARSSLAQTFH